MVKDEEQESPVRFLVIPLERVAEALRSHSRGSEKVLELYALLALNLVRWLVSRLQIQGPPQGPSRRPRNSAADSGWRSDYGECIGNMTDAHQCRKGEYGFIYVRETSRRRSISGGVGDIRDRLFSAFLTIGVFKVEELPDDIQNDYRQTMEDLSWLPAEGDEGKVRATLNEMSDDEATALAERIFRMFVRGAESRE
jgi:hypothetical protein